MIPAYSPQARGRSERSFGTWQNRLPQELRLAGLKTREEANRFLRERDIGEFNRKFSRPAADRGTAFQRCRRTDLKEVFTVQTQRTVDHDNTVAIRDRYWQLEKTKFRRTLAGCTVTICEHLDGRASVRWGPHVVGWFDRHGRPLEKRQQPRCGKGESVEAGENQKPVFTGSPTPLEISHEQRDFHFPTAPTTAASAPKAKAKPKAAHAA